MFSDTPASQPRPSVAFLGTLLEWYQIVVFGTLAPWLARHFFPNGHDSAALAGVWVVFLAGALAPIWGRNRVAAGPLLAIGAAALLGALPGFQLLGWAAPVLLLVLRVGQGLNFGWAGRTALQWAENAPEGRRGRYTSVLQTAPGLGFLLALGATLLSRLAVGAAAFEAWGWRIPLLVSAVLAVVQWWLQKGVLPVVLENAAEPPPVSPKLGVKLWLGPVLGAGVVWYTGHLFTQIFLERTCGLEFAQTRYAFLIALLLAAPLTVLAGHLSDRWGRRPLLLAGLLLACLSYFPIHYGLYRLHNPRAKREIAARFTEAQSVAINAQTGDSTRTYTIWRTFNDSTVMRWDARMFYSGHPDVAAPKPEKVKTLYFSTLWFWVLVALLLAQLLPVALVGGPLVAHLFEQLPDSSRPLLPVLYQVATAVWGGVALLAAVGFFELSKTAEHPAGEPLVGVWFPIAATLLAIFSFKTD